MNFNFVTVWEQGLKITEFVIDNNSKRPPMNQFY